MNLLHLPTSPILKTLPPGFQRIHDRTLHVAKFPGMNPNGYTIALIHGIAASAATWLPVIRNLMPAASGFLVFDMPGHGLSPAPKPPFSCIDAYECTRACLLNNLRKDKKNLIIGNSLGGSFALKFTLENADIVSRCALISPAGAPFPVSAHAVIDRFLPHSLAQANKIIDDVWIRPTLGARMIAPLLLHTATQPGFISMMKSITDIDDVQDCPLKSWLFTPEELDTLQTPACLIWGGLDRILPREMRDYFDTYLPQNVDRFFPDDFGHSPQLDTPKRLAKILLEWLAHEPNLQKA
ncbi:MAG: alpha/beta hydrolase [Proteobacteria bacterium]|nr:alpha/beta hydrolase [Pseudomonadota bacterium]